MERGEECARDRAAQGQVDTGWQQAGGRLSEMEAYELAWQREADEWAAQVDREIHSAELDRIRSEARERDREAQAKLTEAPVRAISSGAARLVSHPVNTNQSDPDHDPDQVRIVIRLIRISHDSDPDQVRIVIPVIRISHDMTVIRIKSE